MAAVMAFETETRPGGGRNEDTHNLAKTLKQCAVDT